MYAAKIEVGKKIAWLTFSDNGLFSLSFPTGNAPQPPNTILKQIGITKKIESYFKGIKVDFNAKIDWSEYSDFEKQVLTNCRLITYGKSVSYKKLAKMVKSINAYRAVGNALAKNRLPVIIPCHRIIKSDGELGGFSGGAGTKEKLLEMEKNGSSQY